MSWTGGPSLITSSYSRIITKSESRLVADLLTDELKEFLELLFATKDLLTTERLKMITRTDV